jgi:uncharacterized surface protein with fasciclin (FAS1) repeats
MKRTTLALAASIAALAFVAACQPAAAPAPEATPAAEPAPPAPPPIGNIVEEATKAGGFATLLQAATAAGVAEALTGPGPITVFAPNDAAFAALPAGTVEGLLKPESKDKLAAILKHHVINGEVMAAAIAAGKTEVDALDGTKLTIEKAADGTVTVGGAKVITADVDASNGVIHVIDKVILPKAK